MGFSFVSLYFAKHTFVTIMTINGENDNINGYDEERHKCRLLL